MFTKEDSSRDVPLAIERIKGNSLQLQVSMFSFPEVTPPLNERLLVVAGKDVFTAKFDGKQWVDVGSNFVVPEVTAWGASCSDS